MKYIYIIILFFITIALPTLSPIFSQEKKTGPPNGPQKSELSQEELDAFIKENGAWMISKTEADFDAIGKSITALISNNIIPQALDRNIAGEVLLISHLSPPAPSTNDWILGVYETEKEMLDGIEKNAKDGYIPTGMDVNTDAAFVLFIKTGEQILAGRLIKIKTFDEIAPTIQVYYELGFLPSAISTFQGDASLWILFSKIQDQDVSKTTISIKTIEKDLTTKVLKEALTKENTLLIDASYTLDNKALFLFATTTPPKKNKTE